MSQNNSALRNADQTEKTPELEKAKMGNIPQSALEQSEEQREQPCEKSPQIRAVDNDPFSEDRVSHEPIPKEAQLPDTSVLPG